MAKKSPGIIVHNFNFIMTLIFWNRCPVTLIYLEPENGELYSSVVTPLKQSLLAVVYMHLCCALLLADSREGSRLAPYCEGL